MPAALLLEQMDQARRDLGRWWDLCGLSPVQTPGRTVRCGTEVTVKCFTDSNADGPAILLIPAPIKQAYLWDLLPRVSVVRRCIEAGLRVYLVQWQRPGPDQAGLGLADYADRLLLRCLEHIEAETRQRRVILAGHSLGGTLAAIFASLHPQRVSRLLLLDAPLHFGPELGDLDRLVARAPPVSLITAGMPTVPGTFLNWAALAASPEAFHWSRQADAYASLSDPHALHTHLLVERWSLDEMPLPHQLFEDVVENLYRRDRFLRGTLRVGRRIADPRQITAPILSVVERKSRVVPPEAVLPFHDAVSSREKTILWYNGDRGVALQHVGCLVGKNAHERLWPQMTQWLLQV